MATKTVINCMNNTVLPVNQSLNIIIDPQKDNLNIQPSSELNNNHSSSSASSTSSNIIKIQHSCDQSSLNQPQQQQQHQQLLTLSTPSLLNNKTLIDINRNNDNDDDVDHHDQSNDHVLQINCFTTSNEISKENSNTKLEINGFSENNAGIITNGKTKYNNDDDDHNDDDNEEKKQIDLKEIVYNKEEFTKYKQLTSYHHSPEEDEEESGQTTSQQKPQSPIPAPAVQPQKQQHQQVNNGNSKFRENGHLILPNDSTSIYKHNDDHQNDHHDEISHNDQEPNGNIHHNEVTSIGDNDVISQAKRAEVDFSHADDGKRSFNEENSNSLLTKADAFTTSSTPTARLTINDLNLNTNSNLITQTKKDFENLPEINKHVVKIQINPNNSNKNEKQITVVKIENNLENTLEKPEKENIEELQKKEIKENLENLKEKSVEIINESKMVQKPSNNSNLKTVTVSNNTHSSSTTGNATVSSTGSTTVTELNVSNNNYHYYMMSSGQFSPCDTLDSGTGSDLESNGQLTAQSQSSPNLLNKKSNTITPLEMHIKTTKIRVTNTSKSKDSQQQQHRQCSFTDSEESEASSLSCDSLHSNEFLRQNSTSPLDSSNNNNNSSLNINGSSKKIQTFLPDSLLREIKNLKFSSNDYEAENEEEDDILPPIKQISNISNSKPQKYEFENHYEPINTQDYKNAQTDYVQARNNLNNCSSSLKRASLPSKTFVLNTEDGTFIDTKMNSMPRKYEADKYYDFHVNEHANFRSFGNNSPSSLNGDGDSFSISDFDTKSLQDDVFAGYKDIRCGGSNTSTIRSSKGTVRGVKNRVRNGIATFLQLQQPNVKNFKEKDSGKVVLYTTSMGIIRDTYAKCSNVKQILRTLLVKFEERDVFMSVEYQQEIKERMHSDIIKVPQLYVEGQHIGDADTVERLNESGELRQLLKPYKSISTIYTCQTCGGYRLLPCPSCNGSKKSVHRNHFTAEFVALKCMNCDEVGLVKCHNC